MPQNDHNSHTEDHWSQITITNITIMKNFEILWELPKCDTEMKWANAVGKTMLIALIKSMLPQVFSFKKKAKSASHNKLKCNKIRYTCTLKPQGLPEENSFRRVSLQPWVKVLNRYFTKEDVWMAN